MNFSAYKQIIHAWNKQGIVPQPSLSQASESRAFKKCDASNTCSFPGIKNIAAMIWIIEL
jgi:hypothetical protein